MIYTGDIVYKGGRPRLANKKEVLRAKAPECTLEAQDFRNERHRADLHLLPLAVRGRLRHRTSTRKAVTTYRKLAGEYNEVEGISPDGERTLVESSREQGRSTTRISSISGS